MENKTNNHKDMSNNDEEGQYQCHLSHCTVTVCVRNESALVLQLLWS